MFGSKETESSDNESKKSAILDFNGKKYDINTVPDDAKEIIKGLQIADTQFKMQQDNLKLIDISRKTLGAQLNQKLKDLPTVEQTNEEDSYTKFQERFISYPNIFIYSH